MHDIEHVLTSVSLCHRYSFKVKNTDANVDKFSSNQRKSPTFPSDKVDKLDKLVDFLKTDEAISEMWVSSDGKTIVLDKFYNQQNDLYLPYKGPEEEVLLNRAEIDKSKAIRMTDQIMLGYEQAAKKAGRNPRDAGLTRIVHKQIATESTEEVIKQVTTRVGNDFKDAKGTKSFGIKEYHFDALLGTAHGTRTAQMLTEYVQRNNSSSYVC